MKQIKWFDRKFDFTNTETIFPSIIERLEGTALRLKHKITQISSDQLHLKFKNKWSIKENIGHLIDLEPIWIGRLDDILKGKEYLRSADLENKKTDSANHNAKDINDLLSEFQKIREITLHKLESISEKDVFLYALHPRLKIPMRIMDLFYFVAEHDHHHLAQISLLT
jgi:uncharacterized damage-inducible protein DinB